MRRLNNKGMTITEIMVSLMLVSIVLIMLINLFINVRQVYSSSKVQADYQILNSNVIKAIGNDISNYGLLSVSPNSGTANEVLFTFNAYRKTDPNENIRKKLRIYNEGNINYISYQFVANDSNSITSEERVTGFIREIPQEADLDNANLINIIKNGNYIEIKIPISSKMGNIYDINIYGRLE